MLVVEVSYMVRVTRITLGLCYRSIDVASD